MSRVSLNESLSDRKNAMRTELENGMVIDTCLAFDINKWEIAIWDDNIKNDTTKVVEKYENKIDAKKGHSRWVRRMKSKDRSKYNLKELHNKTCEEWVYNE